MTNMISVNCDTTEIWMPVLGYEGIYEVSSKGKVRKMLPDGSTKNMTPSCVGATREYRSVTLTKDKVAKLHYIHRLVAEAFIGLPPRTNPDGTEMRTCPEINHIDKINKIIQL